MLTLDIEPAEYSSLNKVWIEPKSNGYLYGTRVTLTAEPNPAFFFDHWEITGQNEQPTNSTIQILMTNNVRVTAVFRPTWMPSPNEWYLTLNWDIILGRIYVNGDRVWLPGYWTLYHQGDSLAIYAETFFNRTFGGYRMAVDGGPESPVGVPGYQTLILGDRETKGHQRVYIWADM